MNFPNALKAFKNQDLEVFHDALKNPALDINAFNENIGSSLFSKILSTAGSAEFIKACACKENLKSVSSSKLSKIIQRSISLK